MTHALLYAVLVLIWGSTWIMVKFQIGVVPAEASVVYRFVIASALMFGWALLRGLPLRFGPRDHLYIALQGATIFSTNFYLMYLAAAYLTTGLVAVVFSTASAMTMLFSTLLLRRLPTAKGLFGAALGSIGIAIIFWPELAGFSLDSGSGLGLLLSLGGTASFSLGGLVSARNHAAGLSVRGSTAWAMTYGAAMMAVLALASGKAFTFDPAFSYVGSLLYLGIFGSVVAFACYFALLAKIGAERASYATVMFPIVALAISTVFEDYQWTVMAVVGIAFTLAGNALVLMQPKPVPARIAPGAST